MGDYALNYGEDYPLAGDVTNFEAYMFVTTAKHMASHRLVKVGREQCLDGTVYVIDGKEKENGETLTQMLASEKGSIISVRPGLQSRKDMQSLFNKILVRRGVSFPDPNDLSCVLVDLVEEAGEYDPDEYTDVANAVCKKFVQWCRENDRAGSAVQYLEQGNRPPHIHFLYQRSKGRHGEFQVWLDKELEQVE